METESASGRMLIVCRQQKCAQKIAVPVGGEGIVCCPHCHRRFWATTRGGAFVRALRGSLHNQEGIGKSAGTLLGLAALWIGGLWVVRNELPHVTAIMLVAAVSSYATLALLERRVREPNALSGAVKEAKHFFLILALAAALFFGLSIWKTSQLDAVSASTTLRDLEMLRDQFRHKHLAFLKTTSWKLALLGCLGVSLIIPFVHVRKALRETNRLVGAWVRRLFYITTALATFTFAGGLYDGEITRSDAALNQHIDMIDHHYKAYAAAVTPTLLDALADELVRTDDDDDDDDEPTSRAQVTTADLSPPIEAASTSGTRPVTGPKPSAPNPAAFHEAAYRKTVLKDLAAEFKSDAARISENIVRLSKEGQVLSQTPKDLTLQTIQDVRAPAEVPAAERTGRPDMKEVRAIVRGGLGLAMSKVEPAGTLFEGLRATHPLQGELKQFTDVLVDGPIKEAVREIISDAIVESMSDIKKSTKDCINSAISRAKQTTVAQLQRLKSSSRSIAGRVVEISRGIAGKASVAGVETLYRGAIADFPQLWKEASSHLPASARHMADTTFEEMGRRTQGWSDARRAAAFTSGAIELRNIGMVYGNQRKIANVLGETERSVLSTNTIESAYERELEERQRQAAAKEARLREAQERIRLASRQEAERAARERIAPEQAGRERTSQEQQRRRFQEILRNLENNAGEAAGSRGSGNGAAGADRPSGELVKCLCTRTGITTIMPASACRGPC